jgi:hypothetical protein
MSMTCLYPRTTRRIIAAVCVMLACGALALWLIPERRPEASSAAQASKPVDSNSIDLEDPAPSFEVLRHAADTGGNERTRELAIAWLDNQTRLGQPLPAERENWLLATLEKGGSPKWDKEYRFWIFNSAFNALHPGKRGEDLTRLLKRLALDDPERTMRLYALQHLGLQRSSGRLEGALADEVKTMLEQFTTAPESEVAGTAVALLAAWSDGYGSVNQAVISRAIGIASESSRPVDVRITALHAAGRDALPLARALAADTLQPVLLRKAAIACIGHHGGENDTAVLRDIASQSSRLAQAANPALRAIHDRITNPNALSPIPF